MVDRNDEATSKHAAGMAACLLDMNAERAPRNICFADASRLYDASMFAVVALLRGAQGTASKKDLARAAYMLSTQMAKCHRGG